MPPRRPDIPALTGLRFVAALAVVAFHLRGHLAALLPASTRLDPLIATGFLGVDLFFVLSGFILAYHYVEVFSRPRARTYLAFLRHRLARIYPVHLATLLFLAVFVGGMTLWGRPVHNAQAYGIGDLFANLTLTQCWTLRDCGLTWNGPAWSLSAEWFAYLAFPLVAMSAQRLRKGAPLLLAVLATLVLQLAITEVWQLTGGIARISAAFTLGALLARLHLNGLPNIDWAAVGAWAGGSAVIIGLALAWSDLAPTAVIPLFALMVLAMANAPEARLAQGLSGPRLKFWGRASYALYMTHGLVLAVAAEFVRLEVLARESLAARVAVLLAYLIGMLVLAAVAYRQVERPSQKLLQSSRLRSAAAVTAAQHMAQSAPMP